MGQYEGGHAGDWKASENHWKLALRQRVHGARCLASVSPPWPPTN